ncbi:MAG: hypothetical protein H6811_05040 [Phycisphaeraceae bacterium]|nr:hypothetical protein [Phycisphaeraceae bacterium]
MPVGVRTCLWLREDQASLARRLVDLASLEPVLAGSPRHARSRAVADALGIPAADDLRGVLTSADVDAVILLATEGLAIDDAASDVTAIAAAHARGVRLVSLEPVPASALEFASSAWSRWRQAALGATEPVQFVPRLRVGEAFVGAAEVLESFGPPRTLSIEAMAPPQAGSLGARLFSSLDLALGAMGEPETIDASYAPAQRAGSLVPQAGDSLRDLEGEMLALLRYEDGRHASIIASNVAGGWRRRVTMLGAEGRIDLDDRHWVWTNASGQAVDGGGRRDASDGVERNENGEALAAEAITDHLRRVFRRDPGESPIDLSTLLATAQAALLSARTGQPERPATIRRMTAAG